MKSIDRILIFPLTEPRILYARTTISKAPTQEYKEAMRSQEIFENARDGIRTQELLRDQALKLAPLEN